MNIFLLNPPNPFYRPQTWRKAQGVKKFAKLATENAHVNPIDLPVTSDLDPKLPANQRGLAIRLLCRRVIIAVW